MDIQQLLSQWLNNEISTKELAEWYHNNYEGKNIEAELSAMLEKEWDNEDRPEELHYSSEQLQQLVTNVLKGRDVKVAAGRKAIERTGRVYWLKIGRLAAAVFVFIFTGVVLWQRYEPKKQIAAEQPAADIAPGTNKASITSQCPETGRCTNESLGIVRAYVSSRSRRYGCQDWHLAGGTGRCLLSTDRCRDNSYARVNRRRRCAA